MKVSEVTIEDLKHYIRIDTQDDDRLLKQILQSAKAYIKSYTGLTENDVDNKEDMVIALYSLCAEMYDNRQYSMDKQCVNKVVESILNMHCINFV